MRHVPKRRYLSILPSFPSRGRDDEASTITPIAYRRLLFYTQDALIRLHYFIYHERCRYRRFITLKFYDIFQLFLRHCRTFPMQERAADK